MIPLLGETTPSACALDQASQSKKAMAHRDEIRFLDYLGTDFSYLRRFILASNQMLRLVQTEAARSNLEVQEKVVDTIEIAKETLSEAGASAHPFIPCPTHLVYHREAYLRVLSAARSLVPYIGDPVVKLRLRRLLLPLTSTSRFRVMLPSDAGRPKADSLTPPPTSVYDARTTRKAASTSPNPSALPEPPFARRKKRRTPASAVVQLVSSPVSHSSCTVDSTSKVHSSRSATNLRRLRASPYPNPAQLAIRRSNGPTSDPEDIEVTAPRVSVPEDSSTASPPPEIQTQPLPAQTTPALPQLCESAPSPKPTLPPISYVSPKTPEALSLLQQQHRDFRAGYPAYRKLENDLSGGPILTSWDCTAQSRTGLSGINCNISAENLDPYSGLPRNVEVFSKEEYDEADENFRKGLGWFPTRWRNNGNNGSNATNETAAAPKSPPELTWSANWDDAKHHTQPSEPVMSLLPSYSPDVEQETPLAESTCIIM